MPLRPNTTILFHRVNEETKPEARREPTENPKAEPSGEGERERRPERGAAPGKAWGRAPPPLCGGKPVFSERSEGIPKGKKWASHRRWGGHCELSEAKCELG